MIRSLHDSCMLCVRALVVVLLLPWVLETRVACHRPCRMPLEVPTSPGLFPTDHSTPLQAATAAVLLYIYIFLYVCPAALYIYVHRILLAVCI